MVNVAIILILVVLSGCGAPSSPVTRSLRARPAIKTTGTHVFIVPHEDDWQLFAGDVAYDLIKAPTTKVVFIHLTAGDAGKTTSYWEARENASLASIRIVLGFPPVGGDPSEVSELASINGKHIRKHTLRNVRSYYFRLPDGFGHGEGSSRQKGESLLKLYYRAISAIHAVDGSNSFTYPDLKEAIKKIVSSEIVDKSAPLQFYLLDAIGPLLFSHADHWASQVIARSVIPSLSNGRDLCKTQVFEDYRITKKSANLSTQQIGKKVLLTEAYDVVMIPQTQTCNMCTPSHYAWLWRTYMREFECSG